MTNQAKQIVQNKIAKHLYVVETQYGNIDVRADTRTQAANIARNSGYEVRSIYMEG